MTDQEIKVVVGALLHDIGKVIYRGSGDKRNHSQSGYEYVRDVGRNESEILNCVHFHHYQLLKDAMIEDDDSAYITYIADNIASAADRRKNDTEKVGFDMAMPLQSVFNILNGNKEEFYYKPMKLDPQGEINYPIKEKTLFDNTFYEDVRRNITNNLKGLEWSEEYINSLLAVLEANLSFVPSSTAAGEMADISLFDHMKMTAAVASCIYQYLAEQKKNNYKEILFKQSKEFYNTKAFYLYSMDVSGIQDFIYTIATANALRTLRARSFYLEILMEHIVDELLSKLNLSRANLIYSGGGHCYLLLPNTQQVHQTTENYMREINQWFMEKFQIALYIAGAGVDCSSNDLKNEPQGSYSELFRGISKKLSSKKSARYSAEDIVNLNSLSRKSYERECKVCKNISDVNEEGVCKNCQLIEEFSKNILYSDFFTVLKDSEKCGLPLPGNYVLVSDNKETVKKRMAEDVHYVRTYSKNDMYTGRHVSTKLWVGSYTTGQSMEEFSKVATGVERIGVLRADVDNLGTAFVSGFCNEGNKDRYVTLSRTATLSRQLSLFFKLYINRILAKPKYRLDKESDKGRFATIVYSGGDDVFIVGSWNEIIELAVDIKKEFKRYTQGTLSISAGIGVYGATYPISAIAEEVAVLEDKSKGLPGKNAITLLEDGYEHEISDGENILKISDGTYSWKEFEDKVIGEKLSLLQNYLKEMGERGNTFLYRLLELLRTQDDKINFARYVYTIARVEPDYKESDARKAIYREFSQKMCQWIKDEGDCRQLKTAITIYVYLNRETEEDK